MSDQTYFLFDLLSYQIEVVYDSFINYVIDQDLSFVQKSIENALKNEQNFEFDCKILTRTKTKKTININGSPFFLDNIVVSMANTLHDIIN